MPKPGTSRRRPPPSAAVRRGGSDLAFTLADDAIADEAIADGSISGKPQLASASVDARQLVPGTTWRHATAPGMSAARATTPGTTHTRD